MTPDELERVLDRQNHKNSGGTGVAYFIAIIAVFALIYLLYGIP